MTEPEDDPLYRNVRKVADRYQRSQQEGEPSVAHRLGQVGVLGWIIVTPILIGIFAGRWLDNRLQSGLFWTAPLLMLGAVVGCWSAWKWMQGT